MDAKITTQKSKSRKEQVISMEDTKHPAYTPQDHTFAVCAYKESPYLEECLQSATSQTLPTNVIVSTSTPNEYIENAAKKFNVPLFVNKGGVAGIGADWNAAIEHAKTPLVTVTHQDDVYLPNYSRKMLAAVNSAETPLIFFTNYGEMREGTPHITDTNRLLEVKRKMLAPLQDGKNSTNKRTRRRILSLGSAICCPSVCICTTNVPTPLFNTNMKCSLDWDAWERTSRLSGAFLYDTEILMRHRIHIESQTTALIEDNTRGNEDLEMLKRFWPTPIAHIIYKVYSKSQKSNG